MSTARNAIWAVAQFGGGRLVVFISTVVLARLLDPESFGLLAIGLLATNIFDRFKDLGAGQALVQSDRRWRDIAPTAATVTVVGSVAMAAACFLSAPWLSRALSSEEEIPNLLRALSLYLLVSGLSVLPDSALRRRLRFSRRTVPELGGAVVKASVSIGFALAGFEVWSLAYGQVGGSIFTTAAYWIIYRRESGLPDRVFGWSTPTAKQLTSFGLSLSGLSLVGLALDNVDYFAIGRRLGPTELGYYTLAFRLPEMLVTGVVIVIGQVLFASFSRVQGDARALRDAFLSASAAVACLTVPLGLGLAAASNTIVPTVLGAQYRPSIPLLFALGVYSTVYALSFHAGEVYKAMGRVRILTWLSVVKVIVLVPAIWVAAGHSTLAVAVTFCCCHILLTFIRLWVIRRVLNLTVSEQTAAMLPALTAGLVMAAAVVGVGRLAGLLPDALLLVLQVVVAAAVYLGVLLVLAPNSLAQLMGVIRPVPLSEEVVSGRNAGLATVVDAVRGDGLPLAQGRGGPVVRAVNAAQASRVLREREVAPGQADVFLVMVESAGPAALAAAVRRLGWVPMGEFSVFPHPAGPSHLVRSSILEARRWYSDGPRPIWGGLSRVTAQLGGVPVLGRFTFQGAAVMVSTTGTHEWPGSPGGEAPWVVHLGEANSGGRSILTYGDPASRTVCRHVRVERDGKDSPAERERTILTFLHQDGSLLGRAPQHVPTTSCGAVVASAQSHLEGTGLATRWERSQQTVVEDAHAVLELLELVADIPVPRERAMDLPLENHVEVSALPVTVRPAFTRGGAAVNGTAALCHGDVWARNIVWSDGPHLIDWENGHVGDPSTDVVLFAVTTLQMTGSVDLGEAAVQLVHADSPLAQTLRAGLLPHLQADVDPGAVIPDVVVHALCLIAMQVPPGGGLDPARRDRWLGAASQVVEESRTEGTR